MKYLLAISIFLHFSIEPLKAQQNHFIYIQTENKQPFYVKLDKNIYSSSASGYVLIAKLKDGVYKLGIGFPKSEWAEQSLVCTVDKTDNGFLLKNFGDKGWGLFNLQTSNVVMAGESVKVEKIEMINKTDAFSTMLSTVVNDSTIRQTEVVKEVKKEPVTEQPVMVNANDTQSVKEAVEPIVAKTDATEAVKEPIKEKMTLEEAKEILKRSELEKVAASQAKTETSPKTSVEEKENALSIISRSLINNNADGTEMVFVDDINGKKDTIRLFIPADKNAKEEKQQAVETVKAIEKPQEPAKNEEKATETKFIELEVPKADKNVVTNKPAENKMSAAKTEAVNKAMVESDIQKPPMINSDCKTVATQDDFLKLRKKMVAEDNEEDMVSIAKKSFKAKCYTVEQVKNLSVLFLKDAGKYAFFDMAYPFVSDSHNFSALQNQLSESYYISRFEAMIRH